MGQMCSKEKDRAPLVVHQPSNDTESTSKEERSEPPQVVQQKLSRLWPHLPRDDLHQLAHYLTSKKRLTDALTTHLMQSSGDCTSSSRVCEGAERQNQTNSMYTTANERQLAMRVRYTELRNDRTKGAMERAFEHYVSDFSYGPVNATVQINDVLLRWNHSSLVIPQLVVEEDGEIAGNQHTPLLPQVTNGDREHTTLLSTEAGFGSTDQECYSFNKCIDIPFTGHSDLHHFVAQVASTIASYNMHFHYGILGCNSQHFVRSILRAIHARNYSDLFPMKLHKHRQLLRVRGRTVKFLQFNSHAELNNYVRRHIDSMSSDDIRFSYCSYLLLHTMNNSLGRWEALGVQESQSHCNRKTCLFREVEKRY